MTGVSARSLYGRGLGRDGDAHVGKTAGTLAQRALRTPHSELAHPLEAKTVHIVRTGVDGDILIFFGIEGGEADGALLQPALVQALLRPILQEGELPGMLVELLLVHAPLQVIHGAPLKRLLARLEKGFLVRLQEGHGLARSQQLQGGHRGNQLVFGAQ
eukprot:scaffold1492_cov257-Pinguiococcus_pyrenoidosus.AAC.16